MQDLKLMIRFNFDGKNELEKIIDEVAKKHNLEVKSNLGQVKVDVDSIGKGFTNITNKITTAVTKFGFFTQGVTQAVNMTKRLIDETVNLGREQIRAEKLVAGAIQATGGAAGFTATQLNRMASELQALTNIGDEETLAKVTSPLLTFKQVQGEVFAEAQMAILDMAEALNQDLQQAAIQVGKALNDPILGVTALRRVGVQLTEQQQEQIKGFMAVNKVAEAQKIILKELNSQFGGQAKNVADPLIQLKNTWGDIKETIGIAILPGLNAIATSTKNWLESLQPATSELEKVTKEATNQQAEFHSLVSVYQTLRFEQGQSVETNVALKDIVTKLNDKYGDYLTGIDLATISQRDFNTAVSDTSAVLLENAAQQAVLAKKQDIINSIGDARVDWIADVQKNQEELEGFQKNYNDALSNLAETRRQYNEELQNEGVVSQTTSDNLVGAEMSVDRYTKLLEKKKTEVENAIAKVNDKSKATITGLELELKRFVNAYEEVFSLQPETEFPDSLTPNSSLLTPNPELEALRNSFKTKQELLTDNYNTQTEFINKNVADETERTNLLTALEEKFNNDIKALKHQEFQEELALAEKKKQLGILSYEELKTTVDEYYEWAKANYAKDSKEYIQALNLMRNTNLRYGKNLKKKTKTSLKILKRPGKLQ